MTDKKSPTDLLQTAEPTRIAALNPDITDSTSRVVSGVITITWPYSHVTNSIAFILAEHDFRLRRDRGQLRVEFHGAAGKAVADSGIGGGDEIRLSVDGAQWEKHEAQTRMPGSFLDWQLKFESRLLLSVHRVETSQHDTIDVDAPAADAHIPSEPFTSTLESSPRIEEELPPPPPPPRTPTPPRSFSSSLPAKRLASSAFESGEYASPAFLKRARVSYGALFEGGLDIFAEKEKDPPRKKKKPRFSMGNTTWRYSSRSPSPEPEPRSESEELDALDEADGVLPETALEVQTTPSRYVTKDEGCQTQRLESPLRSRAVAFLDENPVEEPTPSRNTGVALPDINGVSSNHVPVFGSVGTETRHEAIVGPSQTRQELVATNTNPNQSTSISNSTYTAQPGGVASSTAPHVDRAMAAHQPFMSPSIGHFHDHGLHQNGMHQQGMHLDPQLQHHDHQGMQQDVSSSHVAGEYLHRSEEFANGPRPSPWTDTVSPYAGISRNQEDTSTETFLHRGHYEPVPGGPFEYHDPIPEHGVVHDAAVSMHSPYVDHAFTQYDQPQTREVGETHGEMLGVMSTNNDGRQEATLELERASAEFGDVVNQHERDHVQSTQEDIYIDKSPKFEVRPASPKRNEDDARRHNDISAGPEQVSAGDDAIYSEDEDVEEPGYHASKHQEESIHDDDNEDIEEYDEEEGEEEEEDFDQDEDEDEEARSESYDEEDSQSEEEEVQRASPVVAKQPVFIDLLSDSDEEEDKPQEPANQSVPEESKEAAGSNRSDSPDEEEDVNKSEAADESEELESSGESEGLEQSDEPDVEDQPEEQGEEEVLDVVKEVDEHEDMEGLEEQVEPEGTLEERLEDVSQSERAKLSQLDSVEDDDSMEVDESRPSLAEHESSTREEQMPLSSDPELERSSPHGPMSAASNAEYAAALQVSAESQREGSIGEHNEKPGSPSHPQLEDSNKLEPPIQRSNDEQLDQAPADVAAGVSDEHKQPTATTDQRVVEPPDEMETSKGDLPAIDKSHSTTTDRDVTMPYNGVADDSAGVAFEPHAAVESDETRPSTFKLSTRPTSAEGVTKSVYRTTSKKDQTEVLEPAETVDEQEAEIAGDLAKQEAPKTVQELGDQGEEVDKRPSLHATALPEPGDFDSAQPAVRLQYETAEQPLQQLPTPVITQKEAELATSKTNNEALDGVRDDEDGEGPEEQLLAEYLEYSHYSSGEEQEASENTSDLPSTSPVIEKAKIKPKHGSTEEKDVVIQIRPVRERARDTTGSTGHGDAKRADPSILLAKAQPSITRSEVADGEHDQDLPKLRVTRTRSGKEDPSLAIAKSSLSSSDPATQETPKASRQGKTSHKPRRSDTPDALSESQFSQHSPSVASSFVEDERVSAVKIELIHSLRDDLPDYLPLGSLRGNMNKTADFIAIATTTPPQPHRPKHGPRDYMLEMIVTDPSTAPSVVCVAQIYRPHQACLPLVHAGDIVLLRGFQVLSLKGRGFGMRACDDSGWAVFEKGDEAMLPQIRGAPVEVTDAEVAQAEGLRRWWSLLDDKAATRMERASRKATHVEKTGSGK